MQATGATFSYLQFFHIKNGFYNNYTIKSSDEKNILAQFKHHNLAYRGLQGQGTLTHLSLDSPISVGLCGSSTKRVFSPQSRPARMRL